MTDDPPTGEPRATIVVTCYDQARWIEQALDSVAAQTEQSLQLIVTDDGSSDGSRHVIERWLAARCPAGDLVASDVNIGLPAVLNRALPLIRGRYVVVLNGDDWMDPTRIADQASILDAVGTEVGVVYSDLRVVDADGQPTGATHPPAPAPRPVGDLLPHFIAGPVFGMPSIMVRRRVLDVIGPWDESLVADDFDLLLRVAAAGFLFAYLPKQVANYRVYGASMSDSRQAALAEGRFFALRKLMGRDPETDRAILRRMEGLVVALHGAGHDRGATREHVRYVLRRQPSRRLVRVLSESYLRLPTGALSPAFLRRRGPRRAPSSDAGT